MHTEQNNVDFIIVPLYCTIFVLQRKQDFDIFKLLEYL